MNTLLATVIAAYWLLCNSWSCLEARTRSFAASTYLVEVTENNWTGSDLYSVDVLCTHVVRKLEEKTPGRQLHGILPNWLDKRYLWPYPFKQFSASWLCQMFSFHFLGLEWKIEEISEHLLEWNQYTGKSDPTEKVVNRRYFPRMTGDEKQGVRLLYTLIKKIEWSWIFLIADLFPFLDWFHVSALFYASLIWTRNFQCSPMKVECIYPRFIQFFRQRVP